jgi:hypothetical protein
LPNLELRFAAAKLCNNNHRHNNYFVLSYLPQLRFRHQTNKSRTRFFVLFVVDSALDSSSSSSIRVLDSSSSSLIRYSIFQYSSASSSIRCSILLYSSASSSIRCSILVYSSSSSSIQYSILRRSPVSGRAVLCDRGVDESIDAIVLAVAEEATKNRATTTVFVFVLVVLRLPDRLIVSFFLSFSCESARKLRHSLVVSFCTHSLIDHCITSWFLFCFFFFFFGSLIIVCRSPKLRATLAQRFITANHPLCFSSFVVVVSCPESR